MGESNNMNNIQLIYKIDCDTQHRKLRNFLLSLTRTVDYTKTSLLIPPTNGRSKYSDFLHLYNEQNPRQLVLTTAIVKERSVCSQGGSKVNGYSGL